MKGVVLTTLETMIDPRVVICIVIWGMPIILRVTWMESMPRWQ